MAYEVEASISYPQLVRYLIKHKDVRVKFSSERSVINNVSHIERRLRSRVEDHPSLENTRVIREPGTKYALVTIRELATNNEEAIGYLQGGSPW